jgi:hypothetical protein
MWHRREISVSSCDDQSHYLHLHPYDNNRQARITEDMGAGQTTPCDVLGRGYRNALAVEHTNVVGHGLQPSGCEQ